MKISHALLHRIRLTVIVSIALIACPGLGRAADMSDCIGCHRVKTPAAVRQWSESAHAKAKVGCIACHGSDHDKMIKGEAPVTFKICGQCHPKATAEHTASRHGMALHSGWGCTRNLDNRDTRECAFCHEEGSSAPKSGVQCARFIKQSSEMGEIGCNRCHQVENSCASCHTAHMTDLRIVRDPNNCTTCHMGPDHPQAEMWQSSRHGTLFGALGDKVGPTCQSCHMPDGNHDVSRGITMSSGMVAYPPAVAEKERATMETICSGCHAPAYVKRELSRNDAVHRQGLTLVKEAERIILGLADERLLDPMPEQRPPHPLSGNTLVLDSQLLYEDTSHIERLLFKMKKYDLAKMVKGAYHQNPSYAHWYGNAELKMTLLDIRSEANRLRERRQKPTIVERGGAGKQIEEALEVLKRKVERGAITPEEAGKERKLLLERLIDGM